MDKTRIEWTDATWNPVTGCTKVSPGCDNCYAETFAERWRGTAGHPYENGFDLTLRPGRLDQPLRWIRPRRIFVNSMSDLFHAEIDDEYIAQVFAVMAAAPQHTYQILTKRHGRMRSLLSRGNLLCESFQDVVARQQIKRDGKPTIIFDGRMADPEFARRHKARRASGADPYDRRPHPDWPLPNVWLGVSVEDQQRANLRIPALLDTPAAVRWLSCEPLLGPVNLHFIPISTGRGDGAVPWYLDALNPMLSTRIDWVVVGGESGHGARPMEPAWARMLRDSCVRNGVPFLFKQWGEWAPNGWRAIGAVERISKGRERMVGPPLDDFGHREVVERMGKKRAGRELDGRTWDEYPQAVAA